MKSRMPHIVAWALTVVTAIASTDCAAAPPDLTQPPQVIAFFGDSITHGGSYHEQIQLFLATRYPGRDLWTVNVGKSGQQAGGAVEEMLQPELLARQPNFVFIHFGMNDVGRDGFVNRTEPVTDAQRAKPRERYRQNLDRIVQALDAKGIVWAIISPTIFDDTVDRWNNKGERPQLNAELARFGQIGRELAQARHGCFIDVHTPMDLINQREQKKDPKFSLTVDRVHPRRGGEEVMVYTILKTLKLRPTVYDIVLTAAGAPNQQDGAEVSEVSVVEGSLRFTLAESALPFPTSLLRHYSLLPFNDELNRMRLTVTGLKEGKHELRIDGQAIGAYNAAQWARGVDLSTNESTPQYQQAMKLGNLILERKRSYERAVRDMYSLQTALQGAKLDAGIDWKQVDPAKVLAATDRLIEQIKAEDKRVSGWGSYVLKAGREGFAHYRDIHSGLAEIRKELASQPAVVKRRYEIKPAN